METCRCPMTQHHLPSCPVLRVGFDEEYKYDETLEENAPDYFYRGTGFYYDEDEEWPETLEEFLDRK